MKVVNKTVEIIEVDSSPGSKLRERIEKHGQNKLARKLGISPSFLSMVVNNETNIRVELYKKILKLLGLYETKQ